MRIAFSISLCVLNLPKLNLIDEFAISLACPKALMTWDGSKKELLHAEPVEHAISFIFIIIVSASNFGKQRFKL